MKFINLLTGEKVSHIELKDRIADAVAKGERFPYDLWWLI